MTELDEHMARMRAIRCEHDTPGGDQFCIFCLRARGDRAEVRLRSLARAALPLMVREWYDRPGNEAGGLLHTMLDDGNFDDEDCRLDAIRARESGNALAIAIVDAVTSLPEDEREEAATAGDMAAL